MSDVSDSRPATTVALIQGDSVPAAGGSGSAKAYQAVAQATAMAIQDAADSLRNLSTVSTVAVGTVMAQYIESGIPDDAKALKAAQDIASNAADTFKTVGENAAWVLSGFPSGS